MSLPGLSFNNYLATKIGGRSLSQVRSDGAQSQALAHSKTNGMTEDERLRAVSEEFAGIFLGEVFKAMSAGEQWSDLFNGGYVEQMFRDMAYEEYALEMARGGTAGLSEIVYQSLSRRQAVLRARQSVNTGETNHAE